MDLDADTVWRKRRASFSWLVVFTCLVGIALLSFFKATGTAEHGVDTLGGIAETVIVTYLGVSAADRTGVLAGVAHRLRGGIPPLTTDDGQVVGQPTPDPDCDHGAKT